MKTQTWSEVNRWLELLRTWTLRNVRVRYKQSVIGITWALLQPFTLMIVFALIFTIVVPIRTAGAPYPLSVYSALLPWSLFTAAITLATSSVVNNMSLITQVAFPREVLPLAAIGAALIDFAVGSLALLLLLVVYQWPVSPMMVWLPLVLLVEILLMVGLGLFAAAVNVLYRDVGLVLPLLLQVWMYLSPVIYETDNIPASLRPLIMLNPMAGVVDSFRRVLLYGRAPDPLPLAYAGVISVGAMLAGFAYFKRAELTFADIV